MGKANQKMAKTIVIYRACSVGNPAKNRPIHHGDKAKMVEYAFGSFRKAFEDCAYDLVVLLDRPTDEMRAIFAGCQVEESYNSGLSVGNERSFHKQIKIALEAKQPFLFVEDDYYFLPDSGKKIITATQELPFITPYDHPGYYTEATHLYKRAIRIVGGHHWGSVISTTLTFGGQYESLRDEAETMMKYGWADHPMWVDVTTRTPLYSAIPSLATHLESEWLSFVVKWPFA